MVSYDVKLLFTNIPLPYTIHIIADCLYSPHHNEYPPLKRNIFIKLMHLMPQGMFLYDNKLYQQIDDVAMGYPLTPKMANFFSGQIENKNA